MKTLISVALPCLTMLLSGNTFAAKQDETEGTGRMPQQAGDIYQKTDKKAAQRPGQTIMTAPIAPIKGEKDEGRQTKGEETAGTAPQSGK